MTDNILKWVGGKSRLAPFIIEKMAPHKRYVEPFFGGGNVFWQKHITERNVINDLNGALVCLYRVVNDEKKKEMLKNLLSHSFYGRGLFDYFQKIYKSPDWYPLPIELKAFIYLYLNRVSFNGQFEEFSKKDSGSAIYNLDSIIDKMFRKFQIGKVVIECLPFQKFLIDGQTKQLVFDTSETLIYLDPPYWITTEIKGYYEKTMSKTEHRQLEEILKNHNNAKILISYDDVPEIRSLYKDWNIINTPLKHQSMATRSNTLSGSESTYKSELLIANYELEQINTLFE